MVRPYRIPTHKSGKSFSELGKDMSQSGKNFFQKHYNLKEPIFMKDPEGRNVNNLWTGYGYGGKGRAIASVGLIAGGTVVASNPRNVEGFATEGQILAESEQMDVESLQSTRGDQQGYTAPLPIGGGFSTSGDLSFALHKTRHSGQF